MKCKNTLPHTNIKCDAELCVTDGVSIFLRLESGADLEITPRRSGDAFIICPNPKCRAKNIWYRSKLGS
jgi:hypothetical protein